MIYSPSMAGIRNGGRIWRKPVALLLVLLCFACAAFIALRIRGKSEPKYEGMPLSYWIENYQLRHRQAEQALRAAGSDAVPLIIEDLKARDTWFSRELRKILRKQSLITHRHVPVFIRRQRAIWAVNILATNAQETVPYLERILHEPKPNFEAFMATARTGLPGTLALARLFEHTNAEHRQWARTAIQIGYMGPNAIDASPAMEHFARQLTDSSVEKRLEAVELLAWIPQRDAALLPRIAERLDDPDVRVRRSATWALGRFVRNSNAEPYIRQAFAAADPIVRRNATNALKALYPPLRPINEYE